MHSTDGDIGTALATAEADLIEMSNTFRELRWTGQITPAPYPAEVPPAEAVSRNGDTLLLLCQRFVGHAFNIAEIFESQDVHVQKRTDTLTVAAVLIQEIQEREQSERGLQKMTGSLRRSNRDLEQFARVASHDLREPLRVVTSHLKLLRSRCGDVLGPDGVRYLDRGLANTERMQRLIHALLEYARVGEVERDLEPVDLDMIVRSVQQTLEIAISESRATLDVGKLPTVRADDVQMLQLFQNLIENSIKFRREETPVVSVSAERMGEPGPDSPDKERPPGLEKTPGWCITVADNGIGIHDDHEDRIFKTFQRLHTQEEFPGTGIGLALCRRIVHRHGGEIWLDKSTDPGTKISFTLPDHIPVNA